MKKVFVYLSAFAIIASSVQAATSPSPLRAELLSLIGSPSAHLDTTIRNEFSTKLQAFADTPDVDPSDIIFAIGASVFGVDITPIIKKDGGNVEKPVIVDFAFMKQFMKDVFLTYGCTEDQAEISSEVLIESDKRGIDSHGLGRLKPIYCDRIDKGILWANKPISIIKETETTALVDGNLGLGLYIGPYCMELAIQKAKKIRCRLCRRTTIHSLWYCWILFSNGSGSRMCWFFRYQCPSFHRTHFRCGTDAGNKSSLFWNPIG